MTIYVLSGAPGVGKSIMLKKLLNKGCNILKKDTTREKRIGEDSQELNFVDKLYFIDNIKKYSFLYTKYGHYYGCKIKKNLDYVMTIQDPRSILEIQNKLYKHKVIYLKINFFTNFKRLYFRKDINFNKRLKELFRHKFRYLIKPKYVDKVICNNKEALNKILNYME